jgi:hypothetical protein
MDNVRIAEATHLIYYKANKVINRKAVIRIRRGDTRRRIACLLGRIPIRVGFQKIISVFFFLSMLLLHYIVV